MIKVKKGCKHQIGKCLHYHSDEANYDMIANKNNQNNNNNNHNRNYHNNGNHNNHSINANIDNQLPLSH